MRIVTPKTTIESKIDPVDMLMRIEKSGRTCYKSEDKITEDSAADFVRMIEAGASPQIARSVLPTCLKTEIVVTYNLRQWRHFLKLRTSRAAHPQVRKLSRDLLATFKFGLSPVFGDIDVS